MSTNPPPIPSSDAWHVPVLQEAICAFVPIESRVVVDGTIGLGGHTEAILQRYPDLHVHGYDRDQHALTMAEQHLTAYASRVTLQCNNLSELSGVLLENSVHFLLADLGVSSLQLNQASRGFSFLRDGPLDMRMSANLSTVLSHVRKSPPLLPPLQNPPWVASNMLTQLEWLPNELHQPAAYWVAHCTEATLTRIFSNFGEERFAKKIARAIINQREHTPIDSTAALAHLVATAIPKRFHRPYRHPATRVFQALRVAVNQELHELAHFLLHALDLLAPGGRLAIISFHSLEDRLVKQQFVQWESPCQCPSNWPFCGCGALPYGTIVTKKPHRPSPEEIDENPRARSARLRVFEKAS